MNDRLADLGDDIPAWAREDGDNDVEQANIENIPPNPSRTSTSNSNSWAKDDDDFDFHPEEEAQDAKQQTLMKTFFADIDSIKASVEAITSATERIGEMNREAFVAMSSAQEDELSRNMRSLVTETNKQAKSTKSLLELLKEDNIKYKDDGTINASDMR